MRKLLLITLLAQGLAVLAGPQQALTPTADRNADIYAIYSLMVSAAQYTGTKDPIYLIAGVTKEFPLGPSNSDSLTQRCIRSPQGSEEALQELMADYTAHKNDSMTLERSFTLPKQYEILSANELNQLQRRMNSPIIPVIPSNPRFQGAQFLIYLSNVYFNRDHTMAVASVGVNRGLTWMIFQKSGDHWVEARGWAGCRGSA